MSIDGGYFMFGLLWYSLLVGTIGAIAAKHYYLRKGAIAPTARAPDAEESTRLEQAVDAVALEVERISENQRFLTRVLTERPAERAAGGGRVTTPQSPIPAPVRSISGPRRLI